MSLVITLVGLAGCTTAPATNGLDAAAPTLPDPLRMNDGKRVKTAEAWRQRREEISEMLQRIEYGHMPPPPGNVAVVSEEAPEVVNDGKSTHRQVLLAFGPQQSLKMRVDLFLPAGAKSPCPAVIRVGLDDGPSAQITARGYAYICYDQHALDPDPKEGTDVVGPAQTAYPDYDWGSLAVWAWGASRALDYAVTLPEIDKDRVIVTGHSRGGKTALLAGAMDQRFAMVVPNGSGCGGAACFRIQGPNSETLELITSPKRFKSWFQEDFGKYAGKEDTLPFDQHFLKALVAPRLLLSTDALGDLWANPLGTEATYLTVQPVFNFLGASANNGLHFREGKHDQLPEDYEALLDFADLHFFGKPSERKFDALPVQPDASPKA